VTDLDPETLRALKEDPDEPFRRPGVKLLKDSPSSTVAELQMIVDGRPRPVIYKRFRVTTWTDPWTALVRPTPALRSWVHGQGFRERGLPTARPLAVLHRKRAGLCFEGYLLTEKIDNAQTLHEFMDSLKRLPTPQRQKVLRLQIVQVAQVIREMHRRALSHRDLKAANVLVSRDVSKFLSPFSSGAWTLNGQSLLPVFTSSVWIIDLVGVERYRRLPRSRMLQNLTRLNASFFQHPGLTRSDRLRFLKVYMHWNMHGAGDWKNWWKAIDRGTREKIARNLRRGRPLG
jgi:serine/threonine protein kinase